MDTACPECGALAGRYCDVERRTKHGARANAACSTPPQIFRRKGFYIVGPPGVTLHAPLGVATLDADALNRLVALLRDQQMLGDDDGARVIAQDKRESARIAAAKADLTEQLGLDRKDPEDQAAYEEALRRAARAPTRGENDA